ncbi:hypothetical protein PR048_008836 [Dryococelus australis]|uniref:Mutator-like transposase domain-containing protein n=1 Tax=Dryococelus australis TaxID=614101 RepID=A0ABQ9HY80_9NEOP|nr:hypothetical protein PR048_008836 [Dryococelus australis]
MSLVNGPIPDVFWSGANDMVFGSGDLEGLSQRCVRMDVCGHSMPGERKPALPFSARAFYFSRRQRYSCQAVVYKFPGRPSPRAAAAVSQHLAVLPAANFVRPLSEPPRKRSLSRDANKHRARNTHAYLIPVAPSWIENLSKIDTENCCAIRVQSWTGDRDEIHFETPKSAPIPIWDARHTPCRRNLKLALLPNLPRHLHHERTALMLAVLSSLRFTFLAGNGNGILLDAYEKIILLTSQFCHRIERWRERQTDRDIVVRELSLPSGVNVNYHCPGKCPRNRALLYKEATRWLICACCWREGKGDWERFLNPPAPILHLHLPIPIIWQLSIQRQTVKRGRFIYDHTKSRKCRLGDLSAKKVPPQPQANSLSQHTSEGVEQPLGTERDGAVVAHWTRIWEDPGSIRGPASLISVFHGFPKSLQANVGMGPKQRPWPIPSRSCFHNSSLCPRVTTIARTRPEELFACDGEDWWVHVGMFVRAPAARQHARGCTFSGTSLPERNDPTLVLFLFPAPQSPALAGRGCSPPPPPQPFWFVLDHTSPERDRAAQHPRPQPCFSDLTAATIFLARRAETQHVAVLRPSPSARFSPPPQPPLRPFWLRPPNRCSPSTPLYPAGGIMLSPLAPRATPTHTAVAFIRRGKPVVPGNGARLVSAEHWILARLTSPHPAIQFVPKKFYRVEVGALGGPVQSANIVVGVPLHRDGDSIVMKQIVASELYGPNVLITKIECKNHIMRNYKWRSREIATTNVTGSVPGSVRRLLNADRQLCNKVQKRRRLAFATKNR